ncbi:MAG: hypothetical protein D8M58_12685 [Calditrichaeota bacterium]|nr:hypothetical protein [Calditrichota bacterium]NOG46080.1 hypothetical protein [Calditrichota bacterium]
MKIFSILILMASALFSQNTITSPHGDDLKFSCESCHTTANWNDVPNHLFNHDQVGYPLIGEHKFADCSSCHKSLVFSRVGIACADCHTDIHKGELGIDCESCHNSQNWENRREVFELHNQTNFPLIGVHANLDCESCHINEQQRQFANLSVECQSCHILDYAATISPSHEKAGFDLECQKCHLPSTSIWKTAIFEHPATFPLKDGHSGLDCSDCHLNNFGGTDTDCYVCHKKNYDQATDPNHLTFGFPTVCDECHNGVSWEGTSFDHFAQSGFEVEGAHQNILCTDCHINNQLTGIPRECVGCHREDYNNVDDPNHVENRFELDCVVCHSQNAWEPATFDHNNSDFPLIGAHTSVDCADCHTEGYTQTLPTDCWSCHETDFKGVEDPDHVTNDFDHDCTKCHSSSAWTPANFDHSETDFPLIGAHTSVDCADCHTEGYTQTLPTDCWSCHETDFKGVEDPDHVTNDFDHDCTKCHSSSAWTPANFDHSETDFPLTGAHTSVDCADCHTEGYSEQLPTDCWSCHETDFKGVEDPDHVTNDFDHDCTKCHSSSAWTPANFDHSETDFPLTGAHTSVDCADCHTKGYSEQLPTDCWSCHETDFKGVEDPDHVTNDFDNDCSVCHNTTSWEPVKSFNHDITDFPLEGAHATLDCSLCHSTKFDDTPMECIACHEQEYNETTDPNHRTAQFPGTCEDCHTTSAWTPANWDHDNQYFPIFSGKHKEAWDSCIDCHENISDYGQFECINCHEHNKTDMDRKHKDENDYSYDSQECFRCHPKGKSDGRMY